MPTGTGKGRAQDVTGQAMIVALGGGPPPVGGTGEGDFQDATAQAMLLLLGGGGGGVTATFVYRPGGVAGGTVFTSWPALYAALSLVAGAKTVVIDDRIVSPAVIPAGAYALDQVALQGVSNATTTSGGAALSIADGATFTTPSTLYLFSLDITFHGVATPCLTASAGQEVNVFASDDVAIVCTGAAAFLESAGGSGLMNAQSCVFGDGVHAVFRDDGSGGILFVFGLLGTDILANACAGGAGVHYDYDAGSTPSLPQGGATLFLFDLALGVAYSPAVPGNWPTVPTQVAQALDELAAGSGANQALVNVVTAFHVDPTGGVDAGPILNSKYAAMLAAGQIPWFPKGTYKITTAAPPPVGMSMWIADASSVTFTGANAATVANVAMVYGAAEGTAGYNPAWYALTDIYLDPVAGVDNATGMVGAPIKTMGEAERRWGSSAPSLDTLVIHQLDSQPPGTMPFRFDPFINTEVTWDALTAAKPVGAPFSPVTRTVMVQTAAGNDLTLNGNLPIGAARGQIVHNTTKGSYAIIDAIAGGNATVSQPTTIAPFGLDNTWSAADTYQLLQPLNVYWFAIQPTGGNVPSAFAPGVQIQGVHFVDPSGTPGQSYVTLRAVGCYCNVILCGCDPFFVVQGESSAFTSVINCDLNGGTQISSDAEVLAGACNTANNTFTILLGGTTSWNVITHGNFYAAGAGWDSTIGQLHLVDRMIVQPGKAAILAEATDLLWGAGTVDVLQAASFVNATGATWANALKVATLLLDSVATGSSFNAAALSNPYTPGIAITSANLDTGGGAGNPGLQNPRTGSRYASA